MFTFTSRLSKSGGLSKKRLWMLAAASVFLAAFMFSGTAATAAAADSASPVPSKIAKTLALLGRLPSGRVSLEWSYPTSNQVGAKLEISPQPDLTLQAKYDYTITTHVSFAELGGKYVLLRKGEMNAGVQATAGGRFVPGGADLLLGVGPFVRVETPDEMVELDAIYHFGTAEWWTLGIEARQILAGNIYGVAKAETDLLFVKSSLGIGVRF